MSVGLSRKLKLGIDPKGGFTTKRFPWEIDDETRSDAIGSCKGDFQFNDLIDKLSAETGIRPFNERNVIFHLMEGLPSDTTTSFETQPIFIAIKTS